MLTHRGQLSCSWPWTGASLCWRSAWFLLLFLLLLVLGGQVAAAQLFVAGRRSLGSWQRAKFGLIVGKKWVALPWWGRQGGWPRGVGSTRALLSLEKQLGLRLFLLRRKRLVAARIALLSFKFARLGTLLPQLLVAWGASSLTRLQLSHLLA